MLDNHGVFSFSAAPGNTCSSLHFTQLEGSGTTLSTGKDNFRSRVVDLHGARWLVTLSSSCPSPTENSLVHRAALKLNVNEQVEIMVSFCSDEPVSVQAKLTLRVEDNQCSNTIIQVTGEAYQQIISLDNINTSQEMDQDDERGERREEGERAETNRQVLSSLPVI